MRKIKTKNIMLVALIIIALLLSACEKQSADGSGTRETAGEQQTVGEDPSNDVSENESAEAVLGTRQNPVPLETEVEVGPDWNITVLDITPDAWSVIEETNQFNEPPEEGHQYVMARVKTSYAGDESGVPWVNLSLKYLGSDGNVYSSGCGVLPKPFSDIGEQFPGASAEGNIGWSVPSDAVEGGTIIIEESLSFDDTRVFFEGVK